MATNRTGKAAGKGKAVEGERPKAVKLPIAQLIVTSAYAKTFSTGSRGFYGSGMDPSTGKRYQIVGAVEIGSKGMGESAGLLPKTISTKYTALGLGRIESENPT